MAKQLLIDYIPFEVQPAMILESLEQNGKIIIKGILQRANAQNQNGRVYPRPILEREVKKYHQHFVHQNRALGELDHPDSSVVNLSNVSHNVKDLYWKGDDLVGTIEVLGTPSGNILKELLKAGIKVGISSRGLGSVQETDTGAAEVQEDFELIAFDMVSNPSTHGAFMSPMNESVDKFGQKCINKYCRIQEIVTEILVDMGE